MIKVLLVDDSTIAITILKRMLKSSEIEVVGTAGNGMEALKLIPQVKPDVICTDLHMPVMDGLEFIKEVMKRHPLPILLVSVSAKKGSASAFKSIEAGAIDIFLKPKGNFESGYEKAKADLITKIRILSKIHVFKITGNEKVPIISTRDLKLKTAIPCSVSAFRVVVIGASTGGPYALREILAGLPSNFPVPIICIQHISEGFLDGLVNWLSSLCSMKIEIAMIGTIPMPGIIYFPKENTHLKIDNNGRFILSAEPHLGGHRPSVTVTMKSFAAYYGNSVLGVILTGMGRDGAEGLLDIKKAGGITIAQDEKSSIVFGMPKQAIELGAAENIVPLNEIGPMILSFASQHRERKEYV